MKNQYNTQLPKARTEKLIIKEIDGEVLVYDLTTDKAHCLNHTAALVWKNCDGKNSVGQISTALTHEFGEPVDDNIVWLALDDLKKIDLLETAPVRTVAAAGMDRRQMIRAASVAAIALPVVVSMIAPTSVQAQSCRPSGFSPCNPGAGGTNCCSGVGNCTGGATKVCV